MLLKPLVSIVPVTPIVGMEIVRLELKLLNALKPVANCSVLLPAKVMETAGLPGGGAKPIDSAEVERAAAEGDSAAEFTAASAVGEIQRAAADLGEAAGVAAGQHAGEGNVLPVGIDRNRLGAADDPAGVVVGVVGGELQRAAGKRNAPAAGEGICIVEIECSAVDRGDARVAITCAEGDYTCDTGAHARWRIVRPVIWAGVIVIKGRRVGSVKGVVTVMVKAPLLVMGAETVTEFPLSALIYEVVLGFSVMFPVRMVPLTSSVSTTPPLRIRLLTVTVPVVLSSRSAPSSIWRERPLNVGLPLVGVRSREAVAVVPRTSYV